MNQPNRREFLQPGAAGPATVGLAAGSPGPAVDPKHEGGILLRPLGRTGELDSLLGPGGHASTAPKHFPDEEGSFRFTQRAVREGVTFLDNARD